MPRRKKETGSTTHIYSHAAHPNFTNRELEVVHKAFSCIKDNDEGEAVIDFKKLWKCTGYMNSRSIKIRWVHIMEKLAQNAQALEAARAVLADNETTEDENMGGNQKVGNASVGQHKRKAAGFTTTNNTNTSSDGANNSSTSGPKPKKARATKTGSPKKQKGKKRAAKSPAVEENKRVVFQRGVDGHGHAYGGGEGASSIQGPVNNYGASTYPVQQQPIAQQYTNHAGSTYGPQAGLGVNQYSNIGDAYGAQTHAGSAQQYAINNTGTLQYANNGESSYATETYFDSQQHANNASYTQDFPDPVGNNTDVESAFDEQAQREYDDNFDDNTMFSADARVPGHRPPKEWGFGIGNYGEIDNDNNPVFQSWN
ncbi:hypothetical protein CHU98_g3126 [Xylaria longipes]|nr:hypothetical protein CHU98_g3126 [Xylaria longipes]